MRFKYFKKYFDRFFNKFNKFNKEAKKRAIVRNFYCSICGGEVQLTRPEWDEVNQEWSYRVEKHKCKDNNVN